HGLCSMELSEIGDRLGFFFFFQAEDGIRDLYVTGVQTCALPIYRMKADLRQLVAAAALANARTFGGEDYVGFHTMMALAPSLHRSEERRVGKECRFRWWQY